MTTPTGPVRPDGAAILRIFTHEAARAEHQPLYQAIVLKAREVGLAGATVLRGPMGYGRSAHLRNANIIDLSADLPLVIEIVDAEAKLRAFAADVAGLDDIGLITLEPVEVLHAGTGA